MLINDHFLIAAWIGAWTKSRVRQFDEASEANDVADRKEVQTPRSRANKFAQLRRLGHHRCQLWKRELQVQRRPTRGVIAEVAVYEPVESVGTPVASNDSKGEDVGSALVGEPRSLQEAGEDQYGPSQVADATSDKVELHVEDHQHGQPHVPDASEESKQSPDLELSSTLQLAKIQVVETVSAHDLLPVSNPSAVQNEGEERRDEPRDPDTSKSVHDEKIRPLDQETLTECDKLDTQVKSILSSVTLTDSPSFSEWVPCEETDEHRMSLSDVEFRRCEQSGLQLKSSCDFANVTFVDCKFDRTVFMDVRLCGVTFVRVDFTGTTLFWVRLRNVRLLNTKFDRTVWRATSMRDALMSHHSFKLNPNNEREFGVGAPLASSKTKRFLLDSALSLDDLKQAVGCSEDWKRDIYLREPVPAAVDILTRFSSAKHEAIFDRIMGYCFPGSSVHIYEYPHQLKVPRETRLLQRSYSRRHSTMITYFGSLQEGLSVTDKTSENVPRRGVGGCTGLMRVNKRVGRLAKKHFYGRVFHLQCSAEGAREFLLAHKRRINWVKQIVLYYHWADDQLGLATDMNAWRFLLGTIRHQLAYIQNIRLHMGKSFWEFNKPALGAKMVLSDVRVCPLSEAFKFAAPADRWMIRGDDSTRRTDGTDLQIYIEGAGTQEEVEFVAKLVAVIETWRVGRPLFVRSPKGEEITYRC